MEFVATQKTTRQSPRKVRLVANQVKKLSLPDMIKQLAVIERKSTLVLLKTLKQAISNAQNNHGVALDNLELSELLVNAGPTYKRFRAVSRGRAHTILKRTCHIRVVLKTKTNDAVVPTKNVAPAKTETKKQVTEETDTNKKTSVADRSAQKGTKAEPKQMARSTKQAVKRVSTPRTTNK